MRISKNPEERKKEILDAAEQLFSKRGFANTSINSILQMVGIAKGTFYHHFESKEELLDAIVMRFIDAGVKAAQAIAMDPNLTAPEKLFHILMAQNAEPREKGQMVEQLHQVNNAEMHQKSLVETILQLTPILTKVVEQGIKEGHFQTAYPQETIEFLLVSSQFLLDEGIFVWQPEELMKKVIAFVHIVETTLGAKEGSFAYIVDLLLPHKPLD